MNKHHRNLPQLGSKLFLTDGGQETTLIFQDGLELPHFAAFDLLKTKKGRETLRAYYERYLEIARGAGLGFVLEAPTWRASPDWGDKLGYSRDALALINREAIGLLDELRAAYETAATPVVISGCIGPRGDGYDPGQVMSVEAARAYHGFQAAIFTAAGVDMISAITMTNANEATGVALAARDMGVPSVISFTLETDGRLPTGQTLQAAIAEVDEATGGSPAYFMINCAHPTHFADTLPARAPWLQRIKGIRANASKRSHAELNEAPDLDAGDPVELGQDYRALLERMPHLTVLGGCCGTDHRHVAQISAACSGGHKVAA